MPLFTAGCEIPPWPKGQQDVRTAPTSESPFDRLVPGSTTRRKLSACLNEYVGFLFTIRVDKPIDRPRLGVHRTGASAGSEAIFVELARAHPVHIDRFPGWHIRSVPPSRREHDPLDVLVPLGAPKGGMPPRFEAGVEYVFWAEMMAAKETVAGTYSIPLALEASGKALGTLNVELTVWPMVLPDEGELAAIGEVDHAALFRHHLPGVVANATSATTWHDQPSSNEFDQLLSATLQLLQKHRVSPLLTSLNPSTKVSARGELDVDWSNYDRVVAPLLNGQAFANRVALPVWPLPLDAILRSAGNNMLSAPGSQAMARRYVEECAEHFQENGWLDRAFAFVDSSNAVTFDSMNTAQKTIELVRGARKNVRIATRGFPQEMRPYGWFDFTKNDASDVDIWIPDAQFYDARSMSAQRAMGRRTWLAVDRPPFSGSTALHARPGDTLGLGWQAEWLDAEFLWLGSVNGWPKEASQSDPASCARFDPTVLIFPGTAFGLKEPVPTLRLKRLRETMQYASYVKLLSQHGREHIAPALRTSLVEYAGSAAYRTHFADGRPIGWPEKQELFESARRIMAEEMLGLAGGSTGPSDKTDIGPDLLWRTFMTTTRGIRTRVDGARVRMTGTPLQARVLIETWCTVTNQSRAPVQADVSLLGLPAVCAPLEAEKSIELAVGKSERVGLSFTCDPAWFQTARAADLAVQITGPDQPPVTTPVRLSMLVAEPTARPPVIDGDLSDWAAAAGNVASDFLLIAGECEESEKQCARPALRTFAFTSRDAEFLYVGLNAEARPDTGPGMRKKSVAYDDLIPMDEEDLVEILIDPLNGGTRSPADLYHIVIKRSGVYLIERGITTAPPLGPRRPWQADIDVASRAQSNRWAAEVRIPLSSFDRPGTVRSEVWGFNVTHYNAGQQEFSTWSGAVGNAYDPISLGNLLLP